MPSYRVNKAGVEQARTLIDAGKYDDTTEMSAAAPSADDGSAEIEKHGYEGYAAWHLAVDPDAAEKTKGRYGFPTAISRRSTGQRSSTASNARPRTPTVRSSRPSTSCCSTWTRSGRDPPQVHLIGSRDPARKPPSLGPGA